MKGVIKPGSGEGEKLPTFQELLKASGPGRQARGAKPPHTPPSPKYHKEHPLENQDPAPAAPHNQPVFGKVKNTRKPGRGQRQKNRLISRLYENTMKGRQAKEAGKQPDFKESENTIKGRKGRSTPQRGGRKGPDRFYGEKLKYRERGEKKRPLGTFSQGGGRNTEERGIQAKSVQKEGN